MKQLYYYLLPCLLSFNLFSSAQAPGQLDSTFNAIGFAVNSAGGDNDGEAIAVGPNGNIYVSGAVQNAVFYHYLLQAYLPNGALDTSFGYGGSMIEYTNSGGYLHAVAVQPDGNIVSVGAPEAGDNFHIFRHLPDGSRDSSFAGIGMKMVNLGDALTAATDVVLQPDGKILVGIVSGNASSLFLAAIRYQSDGSPDSTFGFNGLVYSTIAAAAAEAKLALLPDGRFLLGGTRDIGADADFVVGRFTASGIPDSSFGNQGVAIVDLGQDEECTDLTLGDGNEIFLGGTSEASGTVQFAVAKLDSSGQLDAGFTNQSGAFSVGTGDAYCNGLAVLADGSVMLGGDSEDTSQVVFTLVKLLPDGNRDLSFAPNGVLTTQIGTEEDLGNALTLQPDGKILLAGESVTGIGASNIAVARYFSGFVVGVEETPAELAMKVFPHPMQHAATLEFQLTTPGAVQLDLYDLQGRLIATPLSSSLPSGIHRTTLDVSSLSLGPYLLHLQSPDGHQALKVFK